MSGHIFVDGAKSRGYLLVSLAISSANLDPARKIVRGLVMPGQRRVRMVKESDSRRRVIIATLVKLGAQVKIYDAGRRYRTDLERRSACLEILVKDAAQRGDRMLVLEQDDSLVRWDNQALIEYSRQAGCGRTLRYEHRRASAEQLLAIPDAVAWCWAKGGEWRQRVGPIVSEVHEV